MQTNNPNTKNVYVHISQLNTQQTKQVCKFMTNIIT